MALFSTHVDRDELGGGRIRDAIAMRAVGYWRDGYLRRIVHDWKAGDAEFPHVITDAGMLVYLQNGMARVCPTGNPLRYVSFGMPYIKIGGVWTLAPLGTPTRTGNRVSWSTAQADVWCEFGGFKLNIGEVEFKGGWNPGQIAYPVGMQGLTRDGYVFSADGVPVLTLRPMQVYDADNSMDVRAVTTQLVQVGGQWYALATLPSMAGMSRPVLDPTLTLQPAAADGVDTLIEGGSNATKNMGIAADLFAGERSGGGPFIDHSFLQFNLSSIPSTATVTSAVLSLWLSYAGNVYATSNNTVLAYRVLLPWVEGTRSWAVDSPATGATWNRYNTTSNWNTAGCENTTLDREATNIGSHAMITTDAVNSQHGFTLTASKVQEWISGALTNNGIMLRGTTELDDAYAFHSSDGANAAYRPQLVSEYTLPGGAKPLFVEQMRVMME